MEQKKTEKADLENKRGYFLEIGLVVTLLIMWGVFEWSSSVEKAEDFGMIIGTDDGPLTTVYEFQENIVKNGTKSGSAFNFPNTVYNAAGGYLSIKTNMRGVNVTVTNGAQSGMSSLCYAYNEIRQNHAKVMLATGTDENSAVMEKLYRQLGHVANGEAKLYTNTIYLNTGGTMTKTIYKVEPRR